MRNVVEEKKGKRGEVKVWGQGSIYGICQRQIFLFKQTLLKLQFSTSRYIHIYL